MKKVLAIILTLVLIVMSTTSAFAAEKENQKEEVIYVSLNSNGTVQKVYAVNIFSGGSIIDYGDYITVKILNTTDTISQEGDKISIETEADKIYYQGEMSNLEIPWKISIKYSLDGNEYSGEELAGKSGKLEIHIKIEPNSNSKSGFYENYALQMSFSLDTELCNNIVAEQATMANVGSDKQLSFTILPNKGIDTIVTADVKDFEMSGIAINGVRLNLSIEIDDKELASKVNQLISAIATMDTAATILGAGGNKLVVGSKDVKNGVATINTNLKALDNGITELQTGITTIQTYLNQLQEQSPQLVKGSAKIKGALLEVQTALAGVEAASGDLSKLVVASGDIKTAIDSICQGAADLEKSVGYSQYKALMNKNGLDINALKAQNIQLIEELKTQITALEAKLLQVKNVTGSEKQAAELQEQIKQFGQIVTLLEGNNSVYAGTEGYISSIAEKIPMLTAGMTELKSKYMEFDTAINKMVGSLGGTLLKLSELSSGINKLVEEYTRLDSGIGEYTDSIAQIIAGYSKVVEGINSAAVGSKSIIAGSEKLYNGSVEVYNSLVTLSSGLNSLSQGTSELHKQTSAMTVQLDKLLVAFGGGTDKTISFVSEKNGEPKAVQFVIKTPDIKVIEEEVKTIEPKERLNLWQKLLRLFRLY